MARHLRPHQHVLAIEERRTHGKRLVRSVQRAVDAFEVAQELW